MPQDVNRATLLAGMKKKLGKSWKASRKKEATVRGGQLPGGIVHGVAVLSSWNLGESQDKKVPYLSITGIVKTPVEFKGVRCTVTHYLQENDYATIEQITDGIANDLKLLVGPDREEEISEMELDDFAALLDALCEEKPEFYFNTQKAKKSDRVYVNLQGLVGDDDVTGDEEEEEEVEEEETEEEEESDESDESDDEGSEDDESDSEDEEEEGDDEGGDDDEGDDTVEDEGTPEPAKGDIYYYKSSPKRTDKCLVKAVRKANETCTLERVSDKKKFENIKWEKLLLDAD
jgi:hypothetical protein